LKIRKVTCWLLRIPFTFPLVKEQQHAAANFVRLALDVPQRHVDQAKAGLLELAVD
jgi:hypothetical protein